MSKQVSDTERPARPPDDGYSGRPGEWYTLSENLYRDYDFLQNTQCYASGGFGPNEHTVLANGRYIQDVVDYHNLIYFKDGSGLYINLYIPSEVTWGGPVVSVEDHSHYNPMFRLPEGDDELNKWLVPDDSSGVFRLAPLGGRREALRFLPFYAVGEAYAYRMYFDAKGLPDVLW